MKQNLVHVFVALALVALGWAAAKAQTAKPTFELLIDAPEGETVIECARGCELSWVERGINPNAQPLSQFKYSCTNSRTGRCGSGHVGGWITP
jgi:hypothetical protein